MPSLCFPSPGSDADVAANSAANMVPRPYNSGGYAGMIDAGTVNALQAEAASGQGAAVFAAGQDRPRGGSLWLLLAVAAGIYLLSDNR